MGEQVNRGSLSGKLIPIGKPKLSIEIQWNVIIARASKVIRALTGPISNADLATGTANCSI